MLLIRLARSKIGLRFVPLIFAHLSFLLPVRKVCESDRLVAFHHPWPSYTKHILLVPKKAIADINALRAADSGLLLEVIKIAQNLAENFGPNELGYRLILNAGAYQDVPQLHFHLISEESTKNTKGH